MTTAIGPVVCRPLFGTPRTDRPTWGPAIAEVARRLGKPPMPHQAEIFDIAFEVDPQTGLLVYSEVIVIGPRQATGKTELLLPVLTHRCKGFEQVAEWSRTELGLQVPEAGPQRALFTAQTADAARQKWRDVHLPRLLNSRYRHDFRARLQQNMEAFMFRNGSMWSPGSTTGKTGGTGDTLDLGVIDEAWSRSDARTELGMRPAMLTRPWSQIWITSMIPGQSRARPGEWKFLAAKRRTGRDRVEAGLTSGTAFFDFSAPEGSDPADPATWYAALPGLGRTVGERKIREDFETMNRSDFEAEYLGWEPKPEDRRAAWEVIPEAAWQRQCEPDSRIADADRPAVAFAIATDPAQSMGTIGVCGLRADGRDHVEIIERHRGTGWLAAAAVAGSSLLPSDASALTDWQTAILDRMKGFAARYRVSAVVVLSSSAAAGLISALERAGLPVRPMTQVAYAQACADFYTSIVDTGSVVHIGQKSLTAAVGGATKRQGVEGGWRWAQESAEPAEPVIAVTLALAGRRTCPVLPRPRVW